MDIIEDLGGRRGPTFPGGLAGGLDTWPTWPPPCDQSLWPNQHAHVAADHSLHCGVGVRAPPEVGGRAQGPQGHQGQQQSALGFRPGLCPYPPPPSPGPCGGTSFWGVYVQGHVSLLSLSPLWMRKQHRETEASEGGTLSPTACVCTLSGPPPSVRCRESRVNRDCDASGVMGWPRGLTGVTRVAQSRGTVHAGCYRCYSLEPS